jgi:hypothetical protein
MRAFELGYKAHSENVPREQNPYDKEKSPKSMSEWDRGWVARARHYAGLTYR